MYSKSITIIFQEKKAESKVLFKSVFQKLMFQNWIKGCIQEPKKSINVFSSL